ncbi:hypothetical protein LNP26_00600 [Klebsiella variicola subsp. variicola]|nr:hypothetical protein [Klebsiella variicola subsp. variicola]
MKKMLRFILLLVVVLGIAAAAGMWKVRQLADSKLLIKEETIFTLGARYRPSGAGPGSLSREGDQPPARFPVAAAGGT